MCTNLFHQKRNQAKVRIVRRINITNTCFYSYSLSAWTDPEEIKLHEFTPQELNNLREAMKESNQVCVSKPLEEVNKELDYYMWMGVKSVRMKDFFEVIRNKKGILDTSILSIEKIMAFLNERNVYPIRQL